MSLQNRSTVALLLGLLSALMAVYLVWLNVRGVRGKVHSPLFRIAIAAFSACVIAIMTVLAMMVGYLKTDGEAIPTVEKTGTSLLVFGVGSFAVSMLCFVAGMVARVVRRKSGS